MQDGSCDQALPLSVMLKEACPGQGDGAFSQAWADGELYLDSLPQVVDGAEGEGFPELSSFLSQDEIDRSLDLAREAFAQEEGEPNQDPPQTTPLPTPKDLPQAAGPAPRPLPQGGRSTCASAPWPRRCTSRTGRGWPTRTCRSASALPPPASSAAARPPSSRSCPPSSRAPATLITMATRKRPPPTVATCPPRARATLSGWPRPLQGRSLWPRPVSPRS
ncbi:hypothetical protein ANANG_G00074720 [Anguilla anguilla]|uniref:Uncharacterized protein n=1 Tax=Anguilla anguilla TaxID=7936 RepID=A0A9D3S056_ANGAN|nr:hypothetical protein ANANG_G00074720 [Anguilla anguilla]